MNIDIVRRGRGIWVFSWCGGVGRGEAGRGEARGGGGLYYAGKLHNSKKLL